MKRTLAFCILFLVIAISKPKAQIFLSESFSTGSLPTGWLNDSLGFPAIHLWSFDNFYNRSITGVGFDTHFAIFDSDENSFDDGIPEDASLSTPIIDISTAASTLYLEFDEQFQSSGPGGGLRMLELSIDSGITWTTLDSTYTDIGYPNPAVRSVYDISSFLGHPNMIVRFHYVADWDWWWAIDNFLLVSRQNCSNPVNAGTAQSTQTSICPDTEFYLSLIGDDQALGLSYQWQSSPDGIIWTDLTGDTSNTTVKMQVTDTYYRCNISCSGQNNFSLPVYIVMDIPTNCYCIGAFSDSCDILDKVIFNTLSNIGSGCNGNIDNYINYPDTGLATTTVYADSTYDLTIASDYGSGIHGAAAWFDFNHDGDFQDVGEYYFISDSIPDFSSDFTISITIPTGTIGNTRMRVRYIWDELMSQASDCGDYSWGETEDYTISVMQGTVSTENIADKNIVIFPQPASDYLRVHTGQISGALKIKMYDQLSRICLIENTFTGNVVLNVRNLSRGIYFLNIQTEFGSTTKKVILN